MRHVFLLLCILFLSSCASKYCFETKEYHPLLEPNGTGVGVQMHIHQKFDEHANLIRDLEPDFIRQDWFSSQGYDNHVYFVDLAEEVGARLIYTIKSEDLNEDLLRQEVSVFDRVIWELENEPDGFWSVEEYFSWATSVSDIIRDENPSACIIGPANKGITDSKDKYKYLEELISMGFDDYVDGISFHTYYGDAERSLDDMDDDFKRVVDLLCDTRKPFIVSEGGPRDIENLEDQVQFLRRIVGTAVDESGGIGFVWYAVEGEAEVPLLVDWERTPFSYELEDYIEERR